MVMDLNQQQKCTYEYTMYIIVNSDLKMSKGKIGAQVGHVIEMIAQKIYECYVNINTPKMEEIILDYKKYLMDGSKKIILKGTQKELEELKTEFDAEYVIDAGRTEIPAGSLTAVAFLPNNKNGERFKNFKLL